MKRTFLGSQLRRLIRLSQIANERKISSSDVLEIEKKHLDATREQREMNRRQFLQKYGQAALAGAAFAATFNPINRAMAAALSSNLSVGIVGAGLAGLSCAYELKKKGVIANIYEANTRVGGRQYSMSGKFPGQVIERGGELIDNLHKTMLGYVQEFGLTVEDVNKNPGEVFYYFNGQHYNESVIVDEFRDFVSAMKADLRLLSGEISYFSNTAYDRSVDNTSLLDYISGRNSQNLAAGPAVKEAIIQTYIAEYGLDPSEQSALNFLSFIHADCRSKFTPFGVFSDERYHVVEGNQTIANNLAQRVSGQIETGLKLVQVKKTSSGKYELTFTAGNKTLVKTHDIVVLTVPFTALRNVKLDASLGLSPEKMNAIKNLGYGMNAKMMVGFNGRPWSEQGGNGSSYSDQANHQTTWETNWSKATASHAVLTDYSGSTRGANLDPRNPQLECARFLNDLDAVYPGAKSRATTVNGQYLVHLEHWPSNPMSLGSYTCYKPGQFTEIAGLEGQACGNLLFAGEHADSFYSWQGFMEGACLSGLTAANDILAKLK